MSEAISLTVHEGIGFSIGFLLIGFFAGVTVMLFVMVWKDLRAKM